MDSMNGESIAEASTPEVEHGEASGKAKGKGKKRSMETTGEPRKYLKTWETAPAQWLNSAGMSRYGTMNNADLFKRAALPLQFTAYGTELADPGEDRRGVGINRSMYALHV
jgi:hypothetical protein